MLGKRRYFRCVKCHHKVKSRRTLAVQKYKNRIYRNWYFTYTCNNCQRNWRKRNRQLARLFSRRALSKKREIINAAKDRPCMDCHKVYPYYVMDFDHRSNKKFNIATSAGSVSMAMLIAEICKCDVVCANCHRMRTFKHKIKKETQMAKTK
jgi:hypothetical protein